MKIVYLLSLPRSGSTLLQRMLMLHPKVETCGEPWLALPLAEMFSPGESFATYGHASLARSGEHLCQQLPNGRDDVLEAGGVFLREVYAKLAGSEAKYFLDKTPRYYRIIPELAKMMPDARFIVLRRDPLAVYASMLNYIEGKLHLLPTWEQDISEGIVAIGDGIEQLAARAYILDYEQLVSDPENTLKDVLEFLELSSQNLPIERLSEAQVPRGDHTGVRKYATVSQGSLNGWARTIDSRTKKRIALKWLEGVSEEGFARYGTDKASLISRLKNLSVKFSLRDEMFWQTGHFYFGYQINVVRWGFARKRKDEPHTLY